MEIADSAPCSQLPAIDPYPESMNAVYVLRHLYFKILTNIILYPTRSLPLWTCDQNVARVCRRFHACYMPHASHLL
jgi:hypothetical protein